MWRSKKSKVAVLLGIVLGLCLPVMGAAAGRTALLLHLHGAIGPATSDYVVKGLERAARLRAEFVILEIDTPGGLDSAMRRIVKAILASPVPVIAYVAPSGARAASAGTYIMYASQIAAMAPATNLGAATPVQLIGSGPDTTTVPKTAEDRKILNDAVAFIQGLALAHGRNAVWAVQAVRNAASLTAGQALQQHVIDLMAKNVPDLLTRLNGRRVTTNTGTVVLHTGDIKLQTYRRGFRVEFLATLTDPTVAYLLLLIGIFGLVFEGFSPGGVLPGVVGAIALLLALYAFHALPVNFAGLALIILGIVLFVTEAFVPAYGTLSIGGLAAFVIGSIILMDTHAPGFAISRNLIGGLSAAAGLIIIGIISFAIRARRRPVVTGSEQLVGSQGYAQIDFVGRQGTVRVNSESWNAESPTTLHAGDPVKIVGRHGLKLIVEPSPPTMEKDQQ